MNQIMRDSDTILAFERVQTFVDDSGEAIRRGLTLLDVDSLLARPTHPEDLLARLFGHWCFTAEVDGPSIAINP